MHDFSFTDRDDRSITHARFDHLEQFLPEQCALIFNDTKVIKARLYGKKESGGAIELLINRPLDAHTINVYIKGRVKEQTPLFFDDNLTATVTALHEDGSREVQFISKMGHFYVLKSFYPYSNILGTSLSPLILGVKTTLKMNVNTKASLPCTRGQLQHPLHHFILPMNFLKQIQSSRPNAFVTLHVGSGTFKPVECDLITDHPMHSEYFDITARCSHPYPKRYTASVYRNHLNSNRRIPRSYRRTTGRSQPFFTPKQSPTTGKSSSDKLSSTPINTSDARCFFRRIGRNTSYLSRGH